MNSGDCFSDSFVLNLIHSTINNCPIKFPKILENSRSPLGGFSSNYIQGIKEQYLIRREELGWNKIKCSILSILHFLLNIIRKKLPIVYRSFIKLQSNK